MPLSFDDLIPQRGGRLGTKASPGIFDDMLATPPAPQTTSPQHGGGIFDDMLQDQGRPAKSSGLSFDDLIPQQPQPATFADRFNAVNGPPSTLTDVAKSGGAGLARGAIGFLGLPADLANLAARGVDYAAGTNLQHYTQPFQNEFGGQRLQSETEKATGPFYQPQTTPGRYAETVGEFAPALIGGPEGLATKLATRVVAPGLASEALGQQAEGTPLEPVVRIAGALGGTLAAGKLASTVAGRLRPAAPTEQELDTAATGAGQGYKDPAIQNLQLKPQAGQDLANLIRTDLNGAKLDKFNGKTYYDIADRLEQPRFGPTLSVADLDAARQDAVVPPAIATSADKRGGAVVKQVIDGYLNGGIPQSHVLAGNADAANAALVDALGNFAAMKRSQDVTNAMGRADTQAGSSYSGGNLENATRQQLRPILNQKLGVAKSQGFQDYTDQEIQSLRDAVNGSVAGNLVRTAGGYLGRGHGLGALGAGVASAEAAHASGAGPMEAIAAGVLAGLGGRALGALGNRLEVNRANAVGAMLRSRSPLAQSRGIPVGGFPNLPALPPSQMLLQSALAPQLPYFPQPQNANQ